VSADSSQPLLTNNQETWYDGQVIALSLYTGQTAVARRSLEAVRAAIGREFMPDGSQPRELRRTRAWTYSIWRRERDSNPAGG